MRLLWTFNEFLFHQIGTLAESSWETSGKTYGGNNEIFKQ